MGLAMQVCFFTKELVGNAYDVPVLLASVGWTSPTRVGACCTGGGSLRVRFSGRDTERPVQAGLDTHSWRSPACATTPRFRVMWPERRLIRRTLSGRDLALGLQLRPRRPLPQALISASSAILNREGCQGPGLTMSWQAWT